MGGVRALNGKYAQGRSTRATGDRGTQFAKYVYLMYFTYPWVSEQVLGV